MKAGAIVFDLDGTLIDSAPDIHAATNALLAEDGTAPLSFEAVQSFVGLGVPHLVSCILGATGREVGEHAAFAARFEARYKGAVTLTRPYPGVMRALQTLAARGHPLGICTNKPLGPTRAVLDHLGLTPFFAAIIGGDSLPQRKPDPAPLHAAFAALGAPPLLFVGDSEVDAACAQNAGVPLALYTKGYRRSPISALAHWAAFDDFADLATLAARAAQSSA